MDHNNDIPQISLVSDIIDLERGLPELGSAVLEHMLNAIYGDSVVGRGHLPR